MKRRIVSFVLVLALVFGLSISASAYTSKQLRAADALYHLDLFRGMSTTSKVYNLDGGLKRFEGTILLLRMIGEEAAAAQTDWAENPFADVTDWTTPYLTYAWKTGLVNGRSATAFDPTGGMSDYMFLTLVLRVLGYSDADGADFVWNEPYDLAKQLGLISSGTPDSEFTRGDAVLIFWNAMSAKFKGTNETLANRLIDEEVFNVAEYAEAKEIWTYGYISSNITDASDPESDDVMGSGNTGTDGTFDWTDQEENLNSSDSQSQGSGAIEEIETEDKTLTYEEYISLSPADQQNFVETTFGLDMNGLMEFNTWFMNAKAQYDEEQNKVVVDRDNQGSIDVSEQLNGQG